MGFPSCRVGIRAAAGAASVTAPTAAQLVEEWPYLEGEVLLSGQLHQGLIPHGAHRTSRCQGWAAELA